MNVFLKSLKKVKYVDNYALQKTNKHLELLKMYQGECCIIIAHSNGAYFGATVIAII